MRIKGRDIPLTKIPSKAIRHILRSPLECYEDVRSAYYLRRISEEKCDPNRPIKVAFIVQMPEIWDKEEPVYTAMVEDSRFEPSLIVVPPYDLVTKTVRTDYENNYFIERYPDAILACRKNRWIGLDEFDYVFYQRPYDHYLPEPMRSSNAVKWTKCCYIAYAYWPLGEMLCGYNRAFFRNVTFAFLESSENAKVIKMKEKKRENRIQFCGYPVVENFCNYDTAVGIENILWTPRWSYDEKIGGSHFFEYKDKILCLIDSYPNIKLIIRPHPLAFDNYISQGLMTVSEKEQYVQDIVKKDAKLDTNSTIEQTFAQTGILISDISSIIIPFFLTERPIIYCKSEIPLSPAFKALLDGMYIADSWEDVRYIYDMLYNGKDPLTEKRHEIAVRLKEEHKGAVENIIEMLWKDSAKRMK